MKKITKILLGALSVLTLGLFVATGAKVNAEDNNSYVFDTLTTEKDATLFGTGDGNGEQLGNTIFYAYDSNKTKSFCYDKNYNFTGLGLNYASGLYLKNTPSATRHVKVVAPSAGTLKLLAYHSNSRTLSLYDSSYAAVSPAQTATTLADRSKVDYIYFTIPEKGTYCLNCSGSIGFYHLEFIPGAVSAFQQEATGQTIGEKAATYIRFIAIISDNADVKTSDFTFKIYRTNGTVTQYITRNVSIYSALNLNGETYAKTLPGESTPHAFDGNNGTEKYAVYVVGFTNETYEGYTVSAVFNYKGVEYPTTGYEF